LESLTPPASLPPARKKEYIDLKKRIAWHEKQLIKKQKSNSPRSSSPQLLHGKTEKQLSSKLLSKRISTELQAKTMDSYALGSLNKAVEEYKKRLDQHKLLEEQEQQRISILTNELSVCVSEIEGHEKELEKMQNKILNLQKLIEVINPYHDCGCVLLQ